LYQVATAALSPADIAAPVRAILHKCKNVEVMLAEVQSVDVNKRMVHAGDLDLTYDYLILATGARHSYFGHPEWERLAPGLKSLEDAVEIRRRILLAFDYAEKISDPAARAAAMTFVIVGADLPESKWLERLPRSRVTLWRAISATLTHPVHGSF